MNNFYILFTQKKLPKTLFILLIFLFSAQPVFSQVRVPFTPRESDYTPGRQIYSIKGDYTMLGNTNITMQSYDSSANNGNKQMIYVDIDGDVNTLNSSSADLVFPGNEGNTILEHQCTEILYAGLYWTGRAHNPSSGSNYPNTFQVTKGVPGPMAEDNDVFTFRGTTTGSNIAVTHTHYRLNITRTSSNPRTVYYTFRPTGSNPGNIYRFSYLPNSGGITVNINGGEEVILATSSITLNEAVLAEPYLIYSEEGNFTLKVTGFRRNGNNTALNQCYAVTDITWTYQSVINVTKNYDKSVVYLKHANATEYTQINALDENFTQNIYYPPINNNVDGGMYSAYAEITDYVKRYGMGTYTVADIALREGNGGSTGYYGGWGMVVIYENAQMNWRDIIVFDGHAYIAGSVTTSHTLPVDGFRTRQYGDINMKLGVMAGEGDFDITGDYFDIRDHRDANWIRLSHSQNTSNNFFNSSIYTGGNARNPNLRNNTGLDISMFDIPNAGNSVITNNQTSTRFRYGSTQDTYIIFCMVMGVDAYIPDPEANNLVVSVKDKDGIPVPPDQDGNYEVYPDSEIEYVLEVRNKGNEPLRDLLINLSIPYTTIFKEIKSVEYFDINGNSCVFNPTLGPAGSIVWDIGDVPLYDDNKDFLFARLRFSVTVTDDCNILASSDECQPEAIVYGSSSGFGALTGTPFSDKGFIYGYLKHPCTSDPNPNPPRISIVVAEQCSESSGSSDRDIRTCVENGGIVPYSEVIGSFPNGVNFYNTVDPQTGKAPEGATRYTATTGFPVGNGAPEYFYAIPTNPFTICYWRFKISVLDFPTFNTTNAVICEGDSVNLSDLVTDLSANSSVYFYTNPEATVEVPLKNGRPVVAPNTSTIYYVRSKVDGVQCFSEETKEITVTIRPVATVSYTINSEICSGTDFHINPADSSGNTVPPNTIYQWAKPADITGITGLEAGSGPEFTGTLSNSTSGTINVTYTLTPITNTSGNSCEGKSFDITLQVKTLPAAPSATNLSVCYDGTIDLSDAVPGENDYRFYEAGTGGEPLANTSVSHITSSTTYWVSRLENGCESNPRTSFEVQVETPPAIPVINSPVQTYCSGETITITAQLENGSTIRWYENATGGEPISTQNPYTTVITATSAPVTRTYYAEAVSANSCASISRAAATVTVNPHSTAVLITSDNMWICSGSDTVLSVTVPGGVTNPDIRWYANDDAGATVIGTGNNFRPGLLTATFTHDTSFYVTVSGSNYCENLPGQRKRIVVTVNQMPTVNITVTPDTALCYPQSFRLNTEVTGLSFPMQWYGWYDPSGALRSPQFSPQSEDHDVTAVPVTTYTPNEADRSTQKISLKLDVQTTVCGYVRDTVNLTILPLPTSASLDLISQPVTPQDMCIDTVYDFKIKATDAGDLTRLKVTFEDVDGSYLVVKNAYYKYPYETGTSVLLDDKTVTSDNKYYIWNFPDGFSLASGDSVWVQIEAVAECGFFSGNIYKAYLDAYGVCGTDPIVQQESETDPFLTIWDAASEFEFEIGNTFAPGSATVSDGDTITWTAVYTLQDTSSHAGYITNGSEYMVALLPKGFIPVENGYTPLLNAPDFADLETIDDEYGIEYTLPIGPGLSDGDQISWEFKFITTNAPCGEYRFYNEVYIVDSAYCGADKCGINLLRGGSYPTVNVSRYEYELDILQTPESYIRDQKWFGSFRFRALTDFYAGDTLFIDFYIDRNNNNISDAGDTLVYHLPYITSDISNGNLFSIVIDESNAITTVPGYQLLAHIKGYALCEESNYPIVTFNGPEILCQGDTTLYYTAPDKIDYSFAVTKINALSGATPRRIPLEGRAQFSSTEDTIRLVWPGQGDFRINWVYSVPGISGENIRLIPVNFDAHVNKGSYLALTGPDTVGICIGTTTELTQFVRDTNQLPGTVISFYDKETGIKIGDNTGEAKVYVSPSATTTYLVKAESTPNGCQSLNVIELTVRVEDMPDIGSIGVISQPDCLENTGSIWVSVLDKGGSTHYEYRLNDDPYKDLIINNGQAIIAGLPAGNYTIYIRDKEMSACTASVGEPITLTPVNSSLTASAIVTNAANCTSTDGTIQIIANGGYAPYQYTINNGPATALPQNGIIGNQFKNGQYYVTVIDSTGCIFAVDEILVQAVNGIEIEVKAIGDADCNELGRGQLTILNYDNQVAPYTYQLNGQGWKTVTVNPMSGYAYPGANFMRVKDANGCMTSDTFYVDQADINLAINKVTPVDATCDGIENGSIILDITADATPLRYTLDGVNFEYFTDGNTIITGLSVGSYDIEIYDANGCYVRYENIHINLSKESSLNIGRVNVMAQPDCETPTGSIRVVVYEGSGNYEYNFNGGSQFFALPTDGIITDLEAGVYEVYVRDAGYLACPTVKSAPVSLTPFNTDFIARIASNPASDCLADNGSLKVQVSGGTPPYQYKLNDEISFTTLPADGLITGLPSGIYTVTVTGSNECEIFADKVFIESVGGLQLSLTQENEATCESNGTVKLKISGGTPNYSYYLAGGNYVNFAGDSVSIPAASGNHTIYVEDASGCIAMDSIYIQLRDNDLHVDNIETEDAGCDGTGGGKITVTVTGSNTPLQYRIDNGTFVDITENPFTIDNLAEGYYTLFIQDINGCETKFDNITINSAKTPDIKIEVISINSQPGCTGNGGSIRLGISGGSGNYEFQMNGNDTYRPLESSGIISNLPAGTYRIFVQDAATLACPPAISDWITLSPLESDLTLQTVSTNSSSCADSTGTVQIIIGGGTAPYLYRIGNSGEYGDLPANNIIPDLATGDYMIMVLDQTGCTASTIARVEADMGINLTLSLLSEATCTEPGTFKIKVGEGTPDYSYKLDYTNYIPFLGDSIILSAVAGIHTIEIRDARNCMVSGTIAIPLTERDPLALTEILNAKCDGTSGGGITVKGTLDDLPESYTINGVTYPVAGSPVNDMIYISGLASGTYNIIFNYSDGCTFELNDIHIGTDTESSIAILSTYIITQPVCVQEGAPGKIKMVPSGGSGNYVYSVDTTGTDNRFVLPADGIIEGFRAGVYTIYLWDAQAQDCPPAVSNPIEVTANVNSLYLTASVIPASDCLEEDGNIRIHVTGGQGKVLYRVGNSGPFLEIPADGNIGNYKAGEYIISAQDEDLICSPSIQVTVPADNSTIGLALAEQAPARCDTNAILEISINPATDGHTWRYQLDGKDWRPFTTNMITESVTAGWHQVWIKNEAGCIISDSITLSNSSGLFANLKSKSDALCDGTSGGEIILEIGGGNGPYYISNGGNIEIQGVGAGEVKIEDLSSGIYQITVTDANGCIVTLEKIGIRLETDFVTAADDYVYTYKNIDVTGNIFDNDFDYQNGILALNDHSLPENGSISINGNGVFYYTPDPDFTGKDTILYVVRNECGFTNRAFLIITVLDDPSGDPRPPVAMPDHYVTRMNTPVTSMYVKANDIDPDGGTLGIPQMITSTLHGSLTYNAADETFTYNPDSGFAGMDFYIYRICNGNGLCDSTQVTIHVLDTIDNDYIIASPDAYTTRQYEALTVTTGNSILLNDIYPAGVTIVTVVTGPEYGELTVNNDGVFTYLPDYDYYGPDFFLYELCVEGSGIPCDTARVTILITANDCPRILPPTVSTPQEFCEPATVADLRAQGEDILWYETAEGGTPLSLNASLEDGKIYYASQYYNDCESEKRSAVKVNIKEELEIARPDIPSSIQYCNGDLTLSQLFPFLKDIVWYTTATGTDTFDVNTNIGALRTLYAARRAGSCESAERTQVTISWNATIDPPTIADQDFCFGAMIRDIRVPEYMDIVWYSSATGPELLSPETLLRTGTYYAAGKTTGCESIVRTPVQITIESAEAPDAIPNQAFCGTGILADIAVSGYGVVWYETVNSSIILPLDTELENGKTYYAAQGNGNCEAARTAVTVTLSPIPANATPRDLVACYGGNIDLLNAVDGTEYKFFTYETGGTSLGNTIISNIMADTIFWVIRSTVNGCESPDRISFTITTQALPEITILPVTDPYICSGEDFTLTASTAPSSLVNVNWYDAATGGNMLSTDNPFTTSFTTNNIATKTYYAEAVSDDTLQCRSETRASVTLTIYPQATGTMITAQDRNICSGDSAVLTAAATGVNGAVFKWYASTDPDAPVLQTGSRFVTDILTAAVTRDTVFYVAVEGDLYCENQPGNRKAVTVKIQQVPTLDIGNSMSACYPEVFNITPVMEGIENISWFGWFKKNAQGIYEPGLNQFSPSDQGNITNVTELRRVTYIPNASDQQNNHVSLELRVQTDVCGLIRDTIDLLILPLPAKGDISIVSQPSTPQIACEDTAYVLKIKSTGEGGLADIMVTLADHKSTTIKVKNVEYKYPYDAPDTEWQPMNLIDTVLEYFYATIPADTFTLHYNDSMLVRFTVNPECGSFGGADLLFLLDAKGACGISSIQQEQVVSDVFKLDINLSDPAEYKLETWLSFDHNFVTDSIVVSNNTSDTIIWRTTFTVTENLPHQNDSIYFLVPPGMKLIPGSFREVNSSNNFTGVEPEISIIDDKGIEWMLSLTEVSDLGTPITFEVEVEVSKNTNCEEVLLYMEIIHKTELTCATLPPPDNECTFYQTYAGQYPSVTIQWYEYAILPEDGRVSTGHMSNNTWKGHYAIKALTDLYEGDIVDVDFYIDQNNNGILDPADTWVYSYKDTTVNINKDSTFLVRVNANIPASAGHQLLANIHGDVLCDDAVIPIVTLFGEEEVCQGDTVIYTTAPDMAYYSYGINSLDGSSGTLPVRIPLEGRSDWSAEEDSIRIVFRGPGRFSLSTSYTIFAGTPEQRNLSATDIYIMVRETPYLQLTGEADTTVCEGSVLELTHFVKDTNNVGTIYVYEKNSGQQLPGNFRSGVYITAYDTTTYILRASVDSSGCHSVNEIEFTVNVNKMPLLGSIKVISQPECGTSTGSIEMVVNGGSGVYEYSINGESSYKDLDYQNGIATISGLSAGNYTFYVREKNSGLCSSSISESITITPVNSNMNAQAIVTDASGCGRADGMIQLIVNGGTAPYRYVINESAPLPLPDNGIIGNNFTNGRYRISIIDTSECQYALNEVVVNAGNGIALTLTTVKDADCLENGILSLEVTGGTAPYSYRIAGQGFIPMESDSVAISINSGSHQVWVMDNTGCETAGRVLIGQNSGELSVELLSTVDASCDGMDNGKIRLAITGTNTPIRYSIDGGNNFGIVNTTPDTVLIDNLSAGIYDILVSDQSGCSFIYDNVRINVSKEPALRVEAISIFTQPNCNDFAGSVRLTITGGSGDYSYQVNGTGDFSTLPVNRIISRLVAGSYYFVIRDNQALACPTAASDYITLDAVNSDLIIRTEVLDASGCNIPDGQIILTAGGGISPYEYMLNNSGNYLPLPENGVIDNLDPGHYIISVREARANGCLAGTMVEIGTMDGINIETDVISPSTCTEEGTIMLKVNGGTAPYSYSLNNMGYVIFTGDSVEITAEAGLHSIKVKDISGCISSVNVEILSSTASSMEVVNITNAACDGTSYGSITVRVKTGDRPLAYTIQGYTYPVPPTGNIVIAGLSTGTYNIIFHYYPDCIFELNNIRVEQDQNSQLEIQSIYVVDQPTCNQNLGSIQLIVDGGSGRYLYNFDNSYTRILLPVDGIIRNLPIGSYTIYVWDTYLYNCPPAISNTINLNARDNTLNVNAFVTPASDCGEDDGEIQISALGGTGTITYRVDSTGNFTDIGEDGSIGYFMPGEYTITVQDETGCTATTHAVVTTEGTDVNLSLSQNFAADCEKDGELYIAIAPSPTDDSWQYRLDGRDWRIFTGNMAKEEVTAGWHEVWVKNSNGCLFSDSITITNESGLQADIENVSPALCDGTDGGSITLNISGGNQPYRISNGGNINISGVPAGQFTIGNLPVGSYHITVTDNNGCIVTMEKVNVSKGFQIIQALDNHHYIFMNEQAFGNLIEDDFSFDLSPLTILNYGNPSHGSLSVNTGGEFVYTSDLNYTGRDSSMYMIINSCGYTDSAWLYITVLDTAQENLEAPIALDDHYRIKVNTALQGFDVRNNDYNPDISPLSNPVIIRNVDNGTMTLHPDGSLSYYPNFGFTGVEEFSYSICTQNGLCDTANVYITVYSEEIYNEKIVALPDHYSVNSDEILTITDTARGILNNDIWPRYATPGISIIEDVKYGNLTVNNDGTFTYEPTLNPGESGTDYFIYELCAQGSTAVCDTAHVYILILGKYCMDIDFTLTCPADTIVTLQYGKCESVLESLGLPTVTIMNGDPGLENTISVTNNAPGDLTFPLGPHRITWYATNECGRTDSCFQWVVVNYPVCGPSDTIYYTENGNLTYRVDSLFAIDFHGIRYPTVRIDCECWTAENLRSTMNRNGDPVNYYVYKAGMYPDTIDNIQKYGRLYNWETAIGNDTVRTRALRPDICPAGWALPSVAQYEALIPYGSDALRTPGIWLQDNTATNTTGFSAVPAGYYQSSSATSRLLLGDAFFWTSTAGKVAHIRYLCPVLEIEDMNESNGVSIRCIKTNN